MAAFSLSQLTPGANALYRRAMWLYLFLLIFEGALRKWILPGLATPLLLVREPIVIWLVIVGMQKGWFKSAYVYVLMLASTLSLIATLIVGHGSILTGLYGWRIYFFHFPFIFIMGKVLTRDDLLKMMKFVLYVSIGMTVLVGFQFYSPQTHWVNVGVGGEGSAGYGGANGYFRPPGTFSFTSGYALFQTLVACCLGYFLLMNDTLPKKFKINSVWLIVMAACFLYSIPTSISRTLFFSSAVIFGFVGFAALRKQRLTTKFARFAVIVGVAVALLAVLDITSTNLDAFWARFDGANRVEGGTENVIRTRGLGKFFNIFTHFDIPVFGYGIGIGTNAGAAFLGGNMYSFGFNAEDEVERVIGECGPLLGLALMFVRIGLSFDILQKSYLHMVNRFDVLPWMFIAGAILILPGGPLGIPTNLGFTMFLSGCAYAAACTSRPIRKATRRLGVQSAENSTERGDSAGEVNTKKV